MASVTMTASFVSSTTITKQSPVMARRTLVVANAAGGTEVDRIKLNSNTTKECSDGRRDVMLALAAAAVCSVAGIAIAMEPKPGTPEAKKLYAPVCVTMPTARICHK